MVLHFKRPVNILFARTRDVGGTARGEMILGLTGTKEEQQEMIDWLEERGLAVSDPTKEEGKEESHVE